MGLLILFFLLALVVSFICSILEASLLSISPSYIGAKKAENKRFAFSLEKFKKNIDLPLSAILTLNTFANTLGAVGVGAQAQKLWGNEYLTITSITLTVSILIFSEIIPKTLGANYWKTLAPVTSQLIKLILYSPLYPIIILAKFITRILKNNKSQPALSHSEFQAITQIGIDEGIFKEQESKILLNLMKFRKIFVKNIMTPRTVVISASEDQTIGEFYKQNEIIRVSRIPVYKKDMDEITGFVLKDDLLEYIIEKKDMQTLNSIRRNIKVVNEQMPILKLFNQLIEDKEHISLVVGEYGEMVGIVTMEDIIETLLGTEIMDEFDNVEDMQAQAKKIWEKRAKRLGLID